MKDAVSHVDIRRKRTSGGGCTSVEALRSEHTCVQTAGRRLPWGEQDFERGGNHSRIVF